MKTIQNLANEGPISGVPNQNAKPMAKLFSPALKFNPDNHMAYWRGLQTLFTSYGPTKSKVVLLSTQAPAPPLTASIDPKSWDSQFNIRSDLQFKPSPALLNFLEHFNITDPIQELLLKVGMHEIGHWEFPRGSGFGCPYDYPTYYASFVEPIHAEVQKSGKFPLAMQEDITRSIANAVMDVINNCNVADVQKSRGGHYAGHSLFWYQQGQENGAYSAEYALFVRLNLACFGNQQDSALLESFMSDDKRVGAALNRLAPLFSQDNVFSKAQWETLASAYAREAIPLMDAKPPSHQYSADSQPSSGGSGSQSQPQEGDKGESQSGSDQGKDSKQDKKEEGQGKKKDEQKGKGEKKEGEEKKDCQKEGEGAKEPQEQANDGKKAAGSAPAKAKPFGSELSDEDKQAIMGGRKPGQGIPFYLKTDEALDAYYKNLANRIPIRAKGPNPTASFPILPTFFSPFDPDEHSAEDIVSGKLFADPLSRRLVQAVGSNLMDLNIPILKSKRNLPDFFFILLDSSGSMMGAGDQSIVPWGNESYYHQGLLAFYGLLHFFEKEGLKHHIKFSGAIFSDVTLGAQDLESLKKRILNPATGGTKLDLAKVLELHKGRQGALFPLVSDGEIGNWSSIKDEFISFARQNQFFMIQIGGESQASKDLTAAGLPVRHISSAADLAKLAIDLTAQVYDSSIASSEDAERKKFNIK